MNIEQLTDLCNDYRVKCGANTSVDEVALVYDEGTNHISLVIMPAYKPENEVPNLVEEKPTVRRGKGRGK